MAVDSSEDLEAKQLPDSYWRRWYVYAIWTLPWVLLVLVWITSAVGVPGGPETFVLIGTAGGIFAIPLGIWALLGYIWDASVLKEAEADWQPSWILWAVGHFIFSPLLTAPLYLILRTRRTGYPWDNGYTIRS